MIEADLLVMGSGAAGFATALAASPAGPDVPTVEACRGHAKTSCWPVCDHRAIRRYGMGAIGPAPLPLGPEFATKMGVYAVELQSTIARFDASAAHGEDTDFGKGTDAYHRFNGDPTHGLNPCLAPPERAPFCAMRLIPGDIGTFLDLPSDWPCPGTGRPGRPDFQPLCPPQRHGQRHGWHISRGRHHHWPSPHLRLYRGPTRGLDRPLNASSQGKPSECL